QKNHSSVQIVIGIVPFEGVMQQMVREQQINANYLKHVKNSNQAYCLKVVESADGLTILIAGNSPQGINYGLMTLLQLLKPDASGQIGVPVVEIYDYPDLQRRQIFGGWRVNQDLVTPAAVENLLKQYASKRMNFISFPTGVFPDVKTGSLHAEFIWGCSNSVPSVLACASRHGVTVGCYHPHVENVLKNHVKEITQFFPGLFSPTLHTIKRGKRIALPDYTNPNTQRFLESVMFEIADVLKAYRPPVMQFWLTEEILPKESLSGPARKQYFIDELKTFVNAFEKVRQSIPDIKLELLFTQHTYPYNIDLMQYFPSDGVRAIYYNGGQTYNALPEDNVRSSVRKIKTMGYPVFSTPLIGVHTNPKEILNFPSRTPHLVKSRVSELVDSDLDGVMAWMGNKYVYNFDSDALGEYAWNRDGRSPREFCIAWATRNGIDSPETFADIISLVEYPARAYAPRFSQLKRNVKRMTEFILEPGIWKSESDPLSAFEFTTHEEIQRLLRDCQKAVELASQINAPELLADCRLLTQWMLIAERYSWIMANQSDQAAVRTAAGEYVQAIMGLRTLRDQRLELLRQRTIAISVNGLRTADVELQEFVEHAKRIDDAFQLQMIQDTVSQQH
ncbi:MAG: glycoside hydrolase family 20 zincin-like fold domain-containing protein, partial [Phycisphaeraceae bacterium JB051]